MYKSFEKLQKTVIVRIVRFTFRIVLILYKKYIFYYIKGCIIRNFMLK